MVKKFFDTYWFNSVLAVIAAVLIILQEVWLGTPFVFLNFFLLGAAAAIGFSWAASVIVYLIWRASFKWNNVGIGAAVGIVAALLTTLLL